MTGAFLAEAAVICQKIAKATNASTASQLTLTQAVRGRRLKTSLISLIFSLILILV
jgi:hypothetical protein